MKLITTNWINIIGVFLAILLYSAVYNQINNDLNYNVFQSIFAALILICLYGIMFWGLFDTELIVLDLLLIVKSQKNLRQKLLIEWLIIIIPFIYWLIKYREWIFLMGIMAFLITQLRREKLIAKVCRV